MKLEKFNFNLIPIDKDLLSLEMNESYKQMRIDKDFSVFTQIKESIEMLEEQTGGKIPNIFSIGNYSQKILQMFKNKRENIDHPIGTIDALILIDRDVDVLTPLSLPITYEGYLDEKFGIKTSRI